MGEKNKLRDERKNHSLLLHSRHTHSHEAREKEKKHINKKKRECLFFAARLSHAHSKARRLLACVSFARPHTLARDPSVSSSPEGIESMGKLKNYDCHKQKYYVPQNKPAWSLLNLKQAAKKIDKEKSSAKKQALGKKKKIQQKLANRKGGQGLRNPANPEFKKILEKVSEDIERRSFLRMIIIRITVAPSSPLSLSTI